MQRVVPPGAGGPSPARSAVGPWRQADPRPVDRAPSPAGLGRPGGRRRRSGGSGPDIGQHPGDGGGGRHRIEPEQADGRPQRRRPVRRRATVAVPVGPRPRRPPATPHRPPSRGVASRHGAPVRPWRGAGRPSSSGQDPPAPARRRSGGPAAGTTSRAAPRDAVRRVDSRRRARRSSPGQRGPARPRVARPGRRGALGGGAVADVAARPRANDSARRPGRAPARRRRPAPRRRSGRGRREGKRPSANMASTVRSRRVTGPSEEEVALGHRESSTGAGTIVLAVDRTAKLSGSTSIRGRRVVVGHGRPCASWRVSGHRHQARPSRQSLGEAVLERPGATKPTD